MDMRAVSGMGRISTIDRPPNSVYHALAVDVTCDASLWVMDI